MSLKTQSKILRILQEENFSRVGGSKTISVDVRVIAATNKNLEEQIEKGTFREDLYYRLNVIPIIVPPLRDRSEDIFLLCGEFLKENAAANKQPKTISRDGIELMMAYHWPGNVRELKNLIERLVILTPGNRIEADHIAPFLTRKPNDDMALLMSNEKSLREAKQGFEREFLRRRLLLFSGNIAQTARSIGVERSYLYRKLKALGLLNDKSSPQ